MMAKHHEKVTLSEQVHPTWVGRSHFGRSIYHRAAEVKEGKEGKEGGKGGGHFLHSILPQTKSISLGVPFSAAAVHHHCDAEEVKKGSKKKEKKARSLESSPDRDELTKPVVVVEKPSLGAKSLSSPKEMRRQKSLPRIKSLERTHATKPGRVGLDFKKSASWSQFVDPATPQLQLEVPEEWVCDMSSLFLGKKFASGNHSRLYHGVYKDQDVAVKLLRLDECEEEAAKLERQFMQEVYCLSQLQHPNIVKFVAASWKPPVCCTIMEYVPSGSLRAFLHKSENGPIPTETIVCMALDVARGMEYLHSQGVVHRDLKSENLVLTEDLHVKLTDFGVGCLETECDARIDDTGTYRWMAPEMISHKHYSKKVDVYSFGVVLWELVTGQLPFEEMTPVQVAYAVVHKNARPKIPQHCPAPLRQLMQECWASNPQKRPNFFQIVQTLENFKLSLNSPDFKFDRSKWHSPSERSNTFLRCFQGFHPQYTHS